MQIIYKITLMLLTICSIGGTFDLTQKQLQPSKISHAEATSVSVETFKSFEGGPICLNSESATLELPQGITGSFKSYMDYRAITDESTRQWGLQQIANTDQQGFRKLNDCYMVALGTGFAPEVGICFEVEFSTGKVIAVVSGDIKDNSDTDNGNKYHLSDNSMIEFIVDEDKVDVSALYHGDMSYAGFVGDIVRISRLRKSGFEYG